jgi:hypothetical protein
MKESQFLGTLLPYHPDFIPIEKAIREKYNLPEISPNDEPISEVYLGTYLIDYYPYIIVLNVTVPLFPDMGVHFRPQYPFVYNQDSQGLIPPQKGLIKQTPPRVGMFE